MRAAAPPHGGRPPSATLRPPAHPPGRALFIIKTREHKSDERARGDKYTDLQNHKRPASEHPGPARFVARQASKADARIRARHRRVRRQRLA